MQRSSFSPLIGLEPSSHQALLSILNHQWVAAKKDMTTQWIDLKTTIVV